MRYFTCRHCLAFDEGACTEGQARFTAKNAFGMDRSVTDFSLNAFQQECLDYHNFFRALHNVEPLKEVVGSHFTFGIYLNCTSVEHVVYGNLGFFIWEIYFASIQI